MQQDIAFQDNVTMYTQQDVAFEDNVTIYMQQEIAFEDNVMMYVTLSRCKCLKISPFKAMSR